MLIKTATFALSSAHLQQCPADRRPEYAFIGRSNVGKSSLINMLCRHKGLAKTSSTPGKTLLINHFLINNEWYLVDLPGYGFARRSKTTQQQLEQMISTYILQRDTLVCLFVLIDIRHAQQRIDRAFIDWLGAHGIPFALIFTKADKVSFSEGQRQTKAWLATLADGWEELPPYFISSATTARGREEILNYIEQYL